MNPTVCRRRPASSVQKSSLGLVSEYDDIQTPTYSEDDIMHNRLGCESIPSISGPIMPPQGRPQASWERLCGELTNAAGEALRAGDQAACDILMARAIEVMDANASYRKIITPRMRQQAEEETVAGKHSSVDLSSVALEAVA